MKYQKTFALIFIVVLFILIGLYITSHKPTVSMEGANNTVSRTAKSNLKPISEGDILGTWSPSFDGDDSMEFSIGEKGEHTFNSWLHDRPSTSGTWSLVGNSLTIVYGDGMGAEKLTVERQSDTLLLEDSTGTINAATRI